MAEKKDGMNKRTTANEIKKLFYTAVRGNKVWKDEHKKLRSDLEKLNQVRIMVS